MIVSGHVFNYQNKILYMSKKMSISKTKLRRLYVEDGLSTYKISKIYGCDPSVIQNRLREYSIPLRQPKTRIKISKKLLKELYWKRGLSTYGIAKETGLGRTTIYGKLIEYGIETRPKKIVSISRTRLKKLYDKGMTVSRIADMYGCAHSVILDKMKKYGLKRRSRSEYSTVYKKRSFDDDLTKKAYMIGFRLGDLKVAQANSDCNVVVSTNTTKMEQVDLMREVYGCYGHFYVRHRNGIYAVSCQLDSSFRFLAPKMDRIEHWLLGNENYFSSFLSGYVDAEGNIGIYDGRARFRVGSYDRNLLLQIYEKLSEMEINAKYRLDMKLGYKQNKDFYRVSVNQKSSLLKLFNLMKPYLKHRKRINDLKRAEKNIIERNTKYNK